MDARKPIFISYRRSDEPHAALLLYEQLKTAFGEERIFKDIDTFEPGDDFPDELKRFVNEADVLLAVIGPRWLTAEDEKGRRIDNPHDWVRLEVVTAIEQAKRVIPVLVNDAPIPHAEELPEDLQPLARKQAVRLSNDRFVPETRPLTASLERMLKAAQAERDDAALKAEAEARRRAEEEAAKQREMDVRKEAAKLAEPTPEKIATMQAMQNWEYIKDRGEIAEHRDHIARFRGHETAVLAREALEELVWASVDTESIDALGAYLEEFPRGAHAVYARFHKARLENEAKWAKQLRESRIKESLDWAKVSVSDDRSVINGFLVRHPEGENAAAARKRLRELRASPNRRLVLSWFAGVGLTGGTIWQLQEGNPLWRVLNGIPNTVFSGHTGSVWSVALSADGNTGLSGSTDMMLRLWDLTTGESQEFSGHRDKVTSVALSADGKTALSGSADTTLRLWDLKTGESQEFPGHVDKVTSVALSADGKTALSGSNDATLRLWDLTTGESREFVGHFTGVRSVALSEGSRMAISAGLIGPLILWNLETGKHKSIPENHSLDVESVALSGDGRTALSGGKSLRHWNLATGEGGYLRGRTGRVLSVALSANGKTALSGSSDMTLRLWDLATGVSREFTGHAGWVRSVALSADSKTALSGSSDGTLRLWDLT